MRGGILGWLSGGRVLIILFVVMLLIGAGFYFVMQAIDGPLLDMIASGEAAMVRLNGMDVYQRTAHFRATVTLDVAYPLVYGMFFIGLLSRLAWRWRWVLIWVPLVAVLADLSENLLQAMALSGSAPEILHAKDVVTPLKAGAFILTIALCALLAIAAFYKHFKAKKIA